MKELKEMLEVEGYNILRLKFGCEISLIRDVLNLNPNPLKSYYRMEYNTEMAKVRRELKCRMKKLQSYINYMDRVCHL